ncbi:4-hydroxy-tetrahydrodipicolinate synthase [Saprospira sp. CCB-QB6]|uniref:4-hydroxy-tetrahydrodipicolinate synthase n=1 Tax=Saprospira sp. CCB-QB6 TaxID=3023936 RepID=UPI002348F298|nr:4-hydroxy-tetrahydrodipicolinate synthase [Saprospira sp. CCB-QB6]WCL80853.1 4-hydroxy-tetrahydrodipicolinate synthase [Saprospira sp. CCB-QB6]
MYASLIRQLRGTGVALVTPFKDGQIDYPALQKLIDHCIEGGVEFLVSMGTTGESVTLSKEEKKALLAFTKTAIAGRVPLVLGYGGNNTAALIEELKAIDLEGVAAILSASPAYNKPSQEGIYQHYMEFAANCPLPIILYNVPGRTSSNISAATCIRLAKASKQFIGVKEASGNLGQAMEIIQGAPKEFALWSGDDNLTLALIALGGDGVISVVANAYPLRFSELVRHGLEDEFREARALHYTLSQLVDLLFVEGNPAGIKWVLNAIGIMENELRLPLVPMQNEQYIKALKAEVDSLR